MYVKNNNDNNLVGVLQEEDPEPQLVLPHPPRVSRLLGGQIVLPGSLLLDNVHSNVFTHRLLSQYLSSLAPAPEAGDGRQLTDMDRGIDREGTVIKL